METGFFFGIDTSNYTTSAAAVTTAGEVFCAKRPLAVPAGDRGLRQSDALFCHTRDLSAVVSNCLQDLRGAHGDLPLLGVAVSDQPRRVEGSYMPCFLAGVSAAKCAADLAKVPFFTFSHQEGHIEAARIGAKKEGRALTATEFYAFHLSGGTTELLLVKEDGFRYQCRLVAATLDLTCGQLIDRCGVAMGLPFPAGAHLEKLVPEGRRTKALRIPKKEDGINLSGMENRFQKRMAEGTEQGELAGFVFDAVIGAVESLLTFADPEKPVLFSGGVSSSRILRAHFSADRFYFAPPAYCADNAIGIAGLCGKGVING